MSHSHTNNLINESSPYLLQHAHNPVNWYPWGETALQKAKEANKPILVSIGYSACHWCHVMERESFEDEKVAKIMNENFINIKVDREERPDLDHIYMDAVQAISGSGGWPLNVFLTPETKPFYGGTYYPPVQAYNRSSWTEVLLAIIQSWNEKRNEIESQAENLTAWMRQSNGIGQTQNIPPVSNGLYKEQCRQAYENIMKTADKEWGGFGNAPKFPQTFVIQYLLQYSYFTDNKEALQHALLSIDKMLHGGIYDQIGGGLARYSTDKEWLAPHFEKMLYDNALLISVLCDAYQLTGKKEYGAAIRRNINFIEQELMDKSAGFYAALDADSEGEEGKYYVWQKDEIETILENDAPLFCEYFDVSEEGNWERKNILRILNPAEQFISDKNIDKVQFEELINRSLKKLFQNRNYRIKPSLDDKIILSWNALMLHALCKAAAALRDIDYKRSAQKVFDFITTVFEEKDQPGRLYHNYKTGIAKNPAFLDDYAFLTEACISLYEISFDTKYLQKAKGYCDYVIDNFSDENNVFFLFTHKDQSDILVRKKEIYDGATPSGNAIMAKNLLKLSVIFDNIQWKQRAEKMISEMTAVIAKYPASFGIWASLLLQQAAGINEIVVTGDNIQDITDEVLSAFIPNKVFMASTRIGENFPMLKDKFSTSGTLIYLCKDYVCLEPVKTAQNLLKRLFQFNKI